jgi:hypothetical protein
LVGPQLLTVTDIIQLSEIKLNSYQINCIYIDVVTWSHITEGGATSLAVKLTL